MLIPSVCSTTLVTSVHVYQGTVYPKQAVAAAAPVRCTSMITYCTPNGLLPSDFIRMNKMEVIIHECLLIESQRKSQIQQSTGL